MENKTWKLENMNVIDELKVDEDSIMWMEDVFGWQCSSAITGDESQNSVVNGK